MAAPVKRDEEVELSVDSLAFGGNGVARLNGFVVFVRRGLPGDTVRARVTKVKRSHAEALAVEVLEPGPARRGAVRALPRLRRLPLPGSRLRRPARGQGGAGPRRAAPDRRDREPAARADRPGRVALPLPQQARVLVHADADGPALGFHRAGRWDEVLEIERCWLTTDLGNAIRNAVRDWAREERLEAYDQASGKGYLRHLVVREGRNTGQALAMLVTAPGERFERGVPRRGAAPLPGGALDPLGDQRHAGRGDEPALELLWGEDAIEEELCGLRFRVRPNAFLQTNTAMAERLYELAIE